MESWLDWGDEEGREGESWRLERGEREQDWMEGRREVLKIGLWNWKRITRRREELERTWRNDGEDGEEEEEVTGMMGREGMREGDKEVRGRYLVLVGKVGQT